MAWDFTTDPEYQKKLDWADQFVRENVEPLDLLYPELAFSPLEEPLKGHRPAEGRGPRAGPVGRATSGPSSAARATAR